MIERNPKIQDFCLMTLAIFAIVCALIYTRPVLVPFVLSVFAYSVLLPLVNILREQLRLPKWAALTVSFLGLIAFSVTVVFFIAASINGLVANVDQYQSKLEEFVAFFTQLLNDLGFSLNQQALLSTFRELPLIGYAKQLSSSLMAGLANLLLTGFFTCFLLAGETRFNSKPPILQAILLRISKYALTKLILSVITGLLVGFILVLFKVELAFMFALLAFILNFIPSLGSIIATLIPLPIVFLQFGTGGEFWAIVALTAVVQVTIGNIVEPKVMGEAMDLHPVSILMFLIFWGLVWGLPGMFLAVPITAVVKIIFARINSTRGISELLAGRLNSF